MEYGPFIILFSSLLALPMMAGVSAVQSIHGEAAIFIAGAAALTTVCLVNYIAVRYFCNISEPTWLLLAFVLGTFASAVDIITGLEADGFVSGFMMMYLRKGEPYLNTPHGALICYWDGTVHYLLYAIMLSSMAFKKDYRNVGLYWAGSIGHSMLVLIPGAVIGKFGVRWSVLLNIPYMFFPFLAAARFLNQRPPFASSPTHAQSVYSMGSPRRDYREGNSVRKEVIQKGQGLTSRPIDLLLISTLILSLLIAVFRGFAVLGCSHDVAKNYIKNYEPYLNDPVAFPKVQMLVYLFYFVPFYVMSISALISNSPTNSIWLTDWSILCAGAAAQAQFPHILAPFYSTTPPEYHIPPSSQSLFFFINVFLLIQPHFLAMRCLSDNSKNKQIPTETYKNK